MINGDTYSSCEGRSKTSALDLSKTKSTAITNFARIFTSCLGDNRAETFSWSGEDASSLGNSILVSLDLLSWLVEMGLSSALPVFTEMDVDDHVVMLDHC